MKGRSWAADLPLVKVPQGEPKPVTVILPYYENPQFLRQQVGWWHTYPRDLAQRLSAIIVDDGSPVDPAAQAMPPVQPFPMRLFRIREDRRWNWLAARNIGMYRASDGWCLLTDMDHVIPETTAQAVISGQHDENVIYGFSRLEHDGAKIAPHPNSWLMTREMFWRVGGYDEALSGLYGTDGDWRRRCLHVAPMHILTDRLIRHEYQADSSTRRYLRKQPEDAQVKAIIATRGPSWRPMALSFPYDEIHLTQAQIRVA